MNWSILMLKSNQTMTHIDNTARVAVEGGGWPFGREGSNGDHIADNDNVPVASQPAQGRAPAPGVDLYDEWPPTRAQARRGDWLQTYTGRKFWPLDPRAEDVCIEDIAHALSMQCRYGGHSMQFYSVAEHSVHIYRWLAAGNYAPNVRLAGLLHDATEAYVADVPRPLKRHLAGYKDAEAVVWRAVAERFGLVGYEDDLPTVVHEGDNRILGDEVARLMVPMEWHAKHDDPIGAEIECWPPERAEAEFLRAFYHCERLREMANG
jgi:hypothetical protein